MASAKKKLGLINGPNLDRLGTREPEIYGSQTLADIEKLAKDHAKAKGYELQCFQSNSEGDIVDTIHKFAKDCSAIIINPAAYTHTSVALRDALSMLNVPIVEVHLSNIYQREEFRQHSFISGVATGVISGFGANGYILAIDAADSILAAK